MSGYAVSDATKYHITYSSNGGQSWAAASANHSGTSITIGNVDNAKTYIVGVRAGNDSGWSGWRNSPSASPFTPSPTPTPEPSNPPSTPSTVTVTRGDGTLTASGYTVSGATKYHITYTSNGGQSWSLAAFNHTASSITINGADNSKSYIVAVRAGNSAGWSGWRNSSSVAPFTPPTPTPAPAPPAAPSTVTIAREDGTLTVSGYAVSGATKYHITYSSNGGQSWAAASDSHTASSITIDGADNAKSYIVAARAGNAGGWSGWRNSASASPFIPTPTPVPVTLTAAEHIQGQQIAVTQSQFQSQAQAQSQTITPNPGWSWVDLTLSGHTGNWWYKANVGPHTACSTNPVTGAEVSIYGLVSGATYTYTAYSDSACNTALDSVTFTTSSSADLNAEPSVFRVTLTPVLWASEWWYKSDKGSHSSACNGPVGPGATTITGLLPATSYIYALYDASDCETNVTGVTFTTLVEPTLTASGVSATTATLAISDWTRAWWHKEVYIGYGKCLSGGTVSGLEHGQKYRFKAYSDRYCDDEIVASPTELTTTAISLTVDNVTGTGARLNLGGWSATDPNWHYRADKGPHASSCSSDVSGGSANLTGLSANTTYTYSAYSDSSCHYSKRIAGVKFTTVVRLTATVQIWKSGTLAISGWTGDWWHDNGQGGGCSKVDAPETQKSVSFNFDGNASYYYKAYSAAGCNAADQIAASASFWTPPKPSITVNHIGRHTATVTLNDWDRQWWYRTNAGSQSNCIGPVAAGTNSVTYSNSGGYPQFEAYEHSGCYGYQSLANRVVSIPNKVVGNIDEDSSTSAAGVVGRTSSFGVIKRANKFTTNGSGAMQNVTIKLGGKVGKPGGITVALHNAGANGKPGSHKQNLTITTIAGGNPNRQGEYIYKCPTNNLACDLSANTSYFIVVSAASVPAEGRHYYSWQFTSADTESGDGGWTIGDVSHIQTDGGAWQEDDQGRSLRFKVHAQ